MLPHKTDKAPLGPFPIKRLLFLTLLFFAGLLCVNETSSHNSFSQKLISHVGVYHLFETAFAANFALKINTTSNLKPESLTVDVVRDFGAKGDGVTDDTTAIQRAINAVHYQGGGTIVFPPGIYVVTSVTLRENITYEGYGATILRPPTQDKWTRTFTTNYQGDAPSKPLIIRGFTFDGNIQNQGEYRNYELEQAHLIFLNGDPSFPGRLQAVIEDCNFKNAVADAISVYTNVDAKIKNIEAIDVFRGGFVLTGGNSSVEVSNLTTRGKVNPGGIDIEVDGQGYGDTLKVDVKLENLNLMDGDFDIAVSEGSNVVGNNIIADAPFYIFSLNSTLKFTHSKFKVGAVDGYINRILLPYHVTFEDCEFYVTRKETGKPYDFFSVADVWWQYPKYPTQHNQRLVFQNVQFKVDSNIRETDKTYAIYLRKDREENNNHLILKQVSISAQFDREIVKDE